MHHPRKKRPSPPYKTRPQFQAPRSTPSIHALKEMLAKSGVALTGAPLEKLWAYHNLLRSRNQDRELTRIVGFEPMVHKHYVDCLIVGNYMTLPSPLVDVGTGAGFPGIPLKLRFPDVEIILAEPRPKRIEFLEEVIEKLQLKKISVFEHKVVSRSLTQPVNGIITRAVEEIEKTVLRTSGCLGPGGKLIFMKGPNCDDELRQALHRFPGSLELIQDEAYTLPGTPHERRLIVLQRTDIPLAT